MDNITRNINEAEQLRGLLGIVTVSIYLIRFRPNVRSILLRGIPEYRTRRDRIRDVGFEYPIAGWVYFDDEDTPYVDIYADKHLYMIATDLGMASLPIELLKRRPYREMSAGLQSSWLASKDDDGY